MNAPATAADFLGLMRKSGIVDDKHLAAYVEKNRLTSSLSSEPRKLADLLVHDGLLTHFQAEQFLQGRWRRFTIGKYKVLERIGAGGMGSVFLCEHKLMRRKVAVKVLPTSQAQDPSALQRFYREARAVAALDHPNIVRAYDIDQEDNLHFLVMEYVDGSSLQEVVQRAGPLDPLRAAHYISQAAMGLQHAHDVAGLVHRDVKPGNIILDRNGTVKVLDLGLARFFFDEEDSLTKHYDENVLGTADYLAPEQALDSHSVDIRGDIYSLGGTFYFCLTGQTPFGDGSVAQKLIWHQSRQPKPIRAFRPDVPDEMIAIINKMMAKDPEQRYKTPMEVALAMESWTRKAIPPPSEQEMPRLSPAAMGAGFFEKGSSRTTGSAPLSSGTRKAWQVPSTPAPQPIGRAPDQPPPTVPAAAACLPTPLMTRCEHSMASPPSDAPPLMAEPEKPAVKPLLPAELELAVVEDEEAREQPQASKPPSQEPDDPVPWPAPAADTEKLTAKADTVPHGPKKPAARRLRKARALERARQKRQRLLWWSGGVTGGVLLVIASVLGWALMPRRIADVIPAPISRPPLFVSHSGKPVVPSMSDATNKADDKNHVSQSGRLVFRTISEAIGKAEDKDHIVALDDVEEQLDLTASRKDLVIEPAPGKALVWRFPRNVASASQLLSLSGVGHLRIRGFTFDGGNHVDRIMTVTGDSPGLRLEDIHLRGFRYFGIVMANAAGTPGEPITFDHVQAPTSEKKEAAVTILAEAGVRHIVFNDCRFDGPYKNLVLVLGDSSLVKDVVFQHTRPPVVLTKETH
jgi:serine/threonine protein kinase